MKQILVFPESRVWENHFHKYVHWASLKVPERFCFTPENLYLAEYYADA